MVTSSAELAEPHADFVDWVCRGLSALGDPDRAVAQQKYMKSAMPYRGVTSGELRAFLRPLLRDPTLQMTSRAQWEATVLTLWDGAQFREERYAATALLGARHYRPWCDPELLPLLRHLIVTGAWWDHVDDLASHHVGPILLRHRAVVTPIMREWMVGDDLWLRRTAIIGQLTHKQDTDLALLSDAIEANLETDNSGERTAYGSTFWIRKAIGWALRQHGRTDPDWVRNFVAAHADRMSGLSRREALKHLG